jgi:hypothetical protein
MSQFKTCPTCNGNYFGCKTCKQMGFVLANPESVIKWQDAKAQAKSRNQQTKPYISPELRAKEAEKKERDRILQWRINYMAATSGAAPADRGPA